MTRRDRILGRLAESIGRRERAQHPGSFVGGRPDPRPDPAEWFVQMFEGAGGEVVSVANLAAARDWIAHFARDFTAVTLGETLPADLAPDLPLDPPDVAPLAISRARGGVAETGSLILDARDGRRTQLLSPTHVVVLDRAALFSTAHEALLAMRDDLPSALGFHSGPSKSADIGQVMVRGVHGPGRLVALIAGPDLPPAAVAE